MFFVFFVFVVFVVFVVVVVVVAFGKFERYNICTCMSFTCQRDSWNWWYVLVWSLSKEEWEMKFPLPETDIASKNGWLEYFPIREAYFQGRAVCVREGSSRSSYHTNAQGTDELPCGEPQN